jgi:cysteine sulfinate desulfinase/cysteine desulfurase-like protein
MGVSPDASKNAIRVSFGWQTQEHDIDHLIQAWKDIYTSQHFKEAI